MMKTRRSWLLYALVAITIPFAEALSCYDCTIDETDGLSGVGTTCPESLTPSTTATCEGLVCLTVRSDYGVHGIVTSLRCTNETLGYTGPITVDRCPLLNQLQFDDEFYIYNDMCCFTKSETRESSSGTSIPYNRTVCGCVDDFCNGNATAYWTKTSDNVDVIAPVTTMTTDDTITTGVTVASFANRVLSNRYFYGFVVIATNVFAALA